MKFLHSVLLICSLVYSNMSFAGHTSPLQGWISTNEILRAEYYSNCTVISESLAMVYPVVFPESTAEQLQVLVKLANTYKSMVVRISSQNGISLVDVDTILRRQAAKNALLVTEDFRKWLADADTQALQCVARFNKDISTNVVQHEGEVK